MCKLTVNCDEQKKAKAMDILKKKGLTITDAIDLYLEAIIQDGTIPEEVALGVTYGPFKTMDELRASLDA